MWISAGVAPAGHHPKKRPGALPHPVPRTPEQFDHFSEVLTDPNMVLRFVPTPFTAVMIAIAMPAAISPF
jgi:hypothetical protein